MTDFWGNAFIPIGQGYTHVAKAEDRFLHSWWRGKGTKAGTVITEVPIMPRSDQHRADAIRLPNRPWQAMRYLQAAELAHPDLYADAAKVRSLVAGQLVQVIEVKRNFTRDGVGQVMVARELFADRFGPVAGRLESVRVVEKPETTPLPLLRLCNRLGIKVEAPDSPLLPLEWTDLPD